MCAHRHTVQSQFNGYFGMYGFYLRPKTLPVVLLSMASRKIYDFNFHPTNIVVFLCAFSVSVYHCVHVFANVLWQTRRAAVTHLLTMPFLNMTCRQIE